MIEVNLPTAGRGRPKSLEQKLSDLETRRLAELAEGEKMQLADIETWKGVNPGDTVGSGGELDRMYGELSSIRKEAREIKDRTWVARGLGRRKNQRSGPEGAVGTGGWGTTSGSNGNRAKPAEQKNQAGIRGVLNENIGRIKAGGSRLREGSSKIAETVRNSFARGRDTQPRPVKMLRGEVGEKNNQPIEENTTPEIEKTELESLQAQINTLELLIARRQKDLVLAENYGPENKKMLEGIQTEIEDMEAEVRGFKYKKRDLEIEEEIEILKRE